MDGHFAHDKMVNPRHLAVNGPACDDTDLMVFGDLEDHVVVQNVKGVVQGTNSQVCRPLETHLRREKHFVFGIQENCLSYRF